jgi:hypothetical protein
LNSLRVSGCRLRNTAGVIASPVLGKVAALVVLALLVIGGIVLAQELRKASRLQDCLMTKSTTCAAIADPSTPAGRR